MKKSLPILASLLIATPVTFAADIVANIPMETDGTGKIKSTDITVKGRHTDENVAGAVGDALRLDGYSTYAEGSIADFTPAGASSFSIWVAPETYPIVQHDVATNEKILIAGTLDAAAKKGWGFTLDKTGKYAFEYYAGGVAGQVQASDLLPCYEWSFLVAVNDPSTSSIVLYRNGEQVGRANSLGKIGNDSAVLTIGMNKGASSLLYSEKAFNGLIDDITIYDGALTGNELAATPQNEADLSIPASRFETDLLRPKYHGMPGANWTNESHGMTYSDGKYHVYFQKNANGPYMSRLHWGHISSENLYDWTEEKIAIAPGEDYDIKGCWSGCVFTDSQITGDLPNILYTGVDYAKAYIVQAQPTDETLIDWEKKGKVIDGRPNGLSDDFRDPYFFRSGNNAYIIVGTAKDGVGAVTLHKYTPLTKRWSNDGKIFFAGKSASAHGTFWEMPNVTQMENGKWLFTCTPQGTNTGVHTLYWVGDIASDGTFVPDTEDPLSLELISQQGYGLLSPTIYQKDGKTLMLGIVPDKLATIDNCNLGWAHTYSFPREISLDENGTLVQKPFSGLTGLRSDNKFEASNFTLDGVKAIEGVKGRQVEVRGVFTVGNVPFGMNLFKNSKGEASITYNPASNRLEVDFTDLNRMVNDNNIYNGRYTCTLPVSPEPGSDFVLDVFADGSVLDIFVNDKWATSMRVYPTDKDADNIEVFSDGGNVNVKNLSAWVLQSTWEPGSGETTDPSDPGSGGIEEIIDTLPEYVNVYNLNGVLVKRNIKSSDILTSLPNGIYVINSKKIAIP
ncbi:MAG: GH32 C-terminal domain-containing protein [Muribaculaceae bacterium]|nr:GH32 C-terminal domain-containing protein [Muribaculaceae bacterium]